MLSPFTIFVILIVVFAVTFVGMAVKSVPQASASVAMSERSSPALLF